MTIILLILVTGTAFADGPGVIAGSEAIAYSSSGYQYLMPQPIYPYLLQMLPGVVGDATKEMPQFDQVKPLTTEKIVRVVTFNGWCLDRIRLEDVEKEILEHLSSVMKKFGVDSTERIRFRVKFKMSSRTIGSGGGGGGSVAGFGGGTNPLAYGSNASIMPAIAVNTADPQFVISYYLLPLEKQESKAKVIWEK
jgi:hypothetical protein